MAQTVKNLPAILETWVRSLDWEDPLEKGMPTHSSILSLWRILYGEFHRQRSLAGHISYCQCLIWIMIVLYYRVAQKDCLNFSVSCYGKNKWTFRRTQCIKILIQFKNHVYAKTSCIIIYYWVTQKVHLDFSIRCYAKIQMNFLVTQYIKILFQFKDHVHAETSPG